MANEQEEHDSGTITPAGRFARMEASLNRIEDKLDAKADVADLTALTIRVSAIEAVGSPDAQESLKMVHALKDHVEALETGRIVSPNNQAILAQFTKVVSDVESLKRERDIKTEVEDRERKAIKEVADTRYNSLRTMVLVLGAIQTIVVVTFTILSALKII